MNSSLSKKKVGKRDYLLNLLFITQFFFFNFELIINSTYTNNSNISYIQNFKTTSSRCIHVHYSVMAAVLDDVKSLLTRIL